MNPHVPPTPSLHDLAFLFLAITYHPDHELSGAEREAVLARLQARFAGESRAALHALLDEQISTFPELKDVRQAAMRAMVQLRTVLPQADRAAVLRELEHVARVNGAILDGERGLLTALAVGWDLDLPQRPEVLASSTPEPQGEAWGVLHDLALIYLVLAQGTDDALSPEETLVILNKLREWGSGRSEADVRAVLKAALQRYAQGPSEEVLGASIQAVKAAMPEAERMAALNDLIQIANADGLFLDDEEDLINSLMDAWSVGAYADQGKPEPPRPGSAAS
jgi:uncharacterized tellurite resistance protein B-like protein/molybdopterin converting factor small subunit